MRSLKFLMVLLITAFTFSVGQACPPITTKTENYVSVQKAYTSQIGVREATGKNDGKAVEMYLKSVNLGKGYAWCSAFVKWSFDQAAVKTTITAWSPSAFNPKNVVLTKDHKFLKEPRAGDVFVLFYPSLKRVGHTGFYDYTLNSKIYSTVEGNTNEAGSREGDGVYRKYRSFNATYGISRWT